MKTLLHLFIATVISSSVYAQNNKHEVSMFDLMQISSHAFGPEYTKEQAFEKASVVVTGYIDSITDGRAVTYPNARLEYTLNTALFKIEISEVLKGFVEGDYVYFEFIRGGIPAEFYDEVKYTGKIELYLTEVDWFDPSNVTITNSDKGLMREVNDLYILLSDDLFYSLNYDADATRKSLPPIPIPENALRDANGRVLRDSFGSDTVNEPDSVKE